MAIRKQMTKGETFLLMLKARKMPAPELEHRFHPVRKFRLDYAWPDQRVGLEVDGGVWVGGAHGRGTGILRDQLKTNLAASLGWRILRTTPKDLASPDLLDHLERALQWRTTPI